MQDRKSSIRSGIGFGLVAIIVCLFFAFYGQLSTASTLYTICFEREESYKLLVQDSDWYGSSALREQTAANEAEGAQSLEGLAHQGLAVDGL